MTDQPQPLDLDAIEQRLAATGPSVRADIPDAIADIEAMFAEIRRLTTELQQERQQTAAIGTVKVWRNEDGREFLFADDVRAAMGVTPATPSGCGCKTAVHPGHYPSCTDPAAVSGA